MESVKDNLCLSCKNHKPAGSLDDVNDACYPCVWHKNIKGEYINYEPDLDKILRKKPCERLDDEIPVTPEEDDEWVMREMGWQGIGPSPAEFRQQKDNVNHPAHYKTGGIETIDFIKAKLGLEGTIAYCIGNSMKYLSRWKDKGGLEDLKKSRWYQDYAINLMESS